MKIERNSSTSFTITKFSLKKLKVAVDFWQARSEFNLEIFSKSSSNFENRDQNSKVDMKSWKLIWIFENRDEDSKLIISITVFPLGKIRIDVGFSKLISKIKTRQKILKSSLIFENRDQSSNMASNFWKLWWIFENRYGYFQNRDQNSKVDA